MDRIRGRGRAPCRATHGPVVKAQASKASIIEVAIQGLSARCGLSSSPARHAIPPPIFLRPENQMAWSGANGRPKPKHPETETISLCPAVPLPVPADLAPLRTFQNTAGLLTRGLNWIKSRQSARSSDRRLQVAACVWLGDKRFVAVIQVDGLQFLVGGGATNVALLAQLNGKESFGDLLKESMTVNRKQIGDPKAKQAREQA